MNTMQQLIPTWRQELRAGGTAETTIHLYTSHIRRYLNHTNTTTTRDTLITWLARPLAPETRKSTRTALTNFFTWTHHHGHTPTNPAADLPPVHIPPPSPRPASDRQIRTALIASPTRTRTMIMLGAVGGLRRAEIANVHTSDLSDDDELTIRGKGGRTRAIQLPPHLAEQIRNAEGWLFPSPTGGHLTPGHVGKLITQALPDGVTPHQLRHAAASALHNEEGLSLLEVREFLGHASVATTQRYVRTKSRRIAAATVERGRKLAS